MIWNISNIRTCPRQHRPKINIWIWKPKNDCRFNNQIIIQSFVDPDWVTLIIKHSNGTSTIDVFLYWNTHLPMTDPCCWYINANIKGLYWWDPWHTINIATPRMDPSCYRGFMLVLWFGDFSAMFTGGQVDCLNPLSLGPRGSPEVPGIPVRAAKVEVESRREGRKHRHCESSLCLRLKMISGSLRNRTISPISPLKMEMQLTTTDNNHEKCGFHRRR